MNPVGMGASRYDRCSFGVAVKGNAVISRLLVVMLPAVWISAIAILSVQNATPVSLKFLVFRSVEIPIGVALGFCATGGMIGTAALATFFSRNSR